jgi:hypothetical protein
MLSEGLSRNASTALVKRVVTFPAESTLSRLQRTFDNSAKTAPIFEQRIAKYSYSLAHIRTGI